MAQLSPSLFKLQTKQSISSKNDGLEIFDNNWINIILIIIQFKKVKNKKKINIIHNYNIYSENSNRNDYLDSLMHV